MIDPKNSSLVAAALRALLVTSVIVGNISGAIAADSPAYKAPRNAYGQPDFSGTWENNFIAVLHRPPGNTGPNVLSPEEQAKLEGVLNSRRAEKDKPVDPNAPAGNVGGLDLPYGNAAWSTETKHLMTVNGQPRVWLITDPADGNLPPMTPAAIEREKQGLAALPDTYEFGGLIPPAGQGANDNPESRSLAERCLAAVANKGGPVLMGGSWGRDRDDRTRAFYNNNYVIAQSADSVGIVIEMPHDQRIIRLGGHHPPADVRYWQGDSIGRYEGDTLVVETTNYRPDQLDFYGAFMRNLKITERFTRVGPDRILYQFHVEDPDAWTKPWGGEYEFVRAKAELYEYACSEGNYALHGILEGQRELDRKKNVPAQNGKKQ